MRKETAAVARGEVLIELVPLVERELRLMQHVAGLARIGLLDDLEAHFARAVFVERDARARESRRNGFISRRRIVGSKRSSGQ